MDANFSLSSLSETSSDPVNTSYVAVVHRGILSQAQHQLYSDVFTWIKVICQPISVICLVLSAVVFLHKEMRNSSTFFLVALNIAEAYNVSMLTIYQVCSLTSQCTGNITYLHILLWTTTFMGLTCRRCVYMYSCLVSMQRFLVIAFPVRSRKICIVQRPFLVCLGVFLLTVAAHVYVILRYQPVTDMKGKPKLGVTPLYRDNKTVFSVVATVVMCAFVFLPLVVGAIFNIGMVIVLKRHARSVQILTTSSKATGANRHRQTTGVVIASTFLLFLLSLPSNVNMLLTYMVDVYGTGKQEHYLYRTLSEAFVISQVLSDVVIFITNICISSAFRKHLQDLFTTCACTLLGTFRRGAKSPDLSVAASVASRQMINTSPVTSTCSPPINYQPQAKF